MSRVRAITAVALLSGCGNGDSVGMPPIDSGRSESSIDTATPDLGPKDAGCVPEGGACTTASECCADSALCGADLTTGLETGLWCFEKDR